MREIRHEKPPKGNKTMRFSARVSNAANHSMKAKRFRGGGRRHRRPGSDRTSHVDLNLYICSREPQTVKVRTLRLPDTSTSP
ncbi:hypothetical protein DY000_02012231 [Brassica cretica]|uniref:Uncharacterized protein n=1 Tax=Brassica cretica TaxID=69181 RepID=A0ABQ7CL35_BRACR|nr:hypothetical protein DY000_02012231 [Brassica cretica]